MDNSRLTQCEFDRPSNVRWTSAGVGIPTLLDFLCEIRPTVMSLLPDTITKDYEKTMVSHYL